MAALARFPAYCRIAADGLLAAAVVVLAVFTILANIPIEPAPWPPPGVSAARRDLARDPLDPALERDLGLSLDRAGDAADADRLMSFAASRSRRDTPTEDWLLVRRLSQGRYDEALRAADTLLRRDIDEDKRQKLFALLVAAAHYDASRPALIARLAPAPWWCLAFLRELVAHADPADTRRVLAALAGSGHPPEDQALAPYVDRLVDLRDYRAAARDWWTFSRPRRDPDAVNDLRAPPPFGWSPAFGEGASSVLDAGSLRVDYDGYAAPQLPRRLVALDPGSHRITWREHVAGDPRMAVEVRCAGTDTILVAASPQGGGAAIPRSLDFVVPPRGCEGQWIAITAIPGDRRSLVAGVFSDWALTAPRPR